jgi:L-threonylcarbamoyladenylate synthase
MNTEILSTHTPQLFSAAVERAVALLCAGAVVALPTETVYGLAANALDETAVAKIFQIKGRPAHNPLIVHVAGQAMARRCVTEFPLLAEKLSRAFWPGPLTLVLPGADQIPANVTAGGRTVAVRWPAHPFHPGRYPRLRFSPRRPQRQPFQPGLAHKRRVTSAPNSPVRFR